MKKLLSSIAFLLLFLIPTLESQTGIIRGTVYDETTGENIMFGNVLVVEKGTGTTTDLDGQFSISLEAGKYTLQVSYVGYSPLTITDIQVEAGSTRNLDIKITPSSQQLEEVVITASQARNTAAAINTLKKNSINVMDGISSQEFKKIGDSDAASAIKRVTGISIEEGKYVYVRGLGDRYTKSTLNGLEIPGLDPDRNTIQLDIFPTNVLDNIIVLKTFTADLPADFTGGVVNVTTKDFPEEKTSQIGIGLGYNANMHFNSDNLTYEGGKYDWLGFDDGTRDIPTNRRTNIPFRVNAIQDPNGAGAEFRSILEDFNSQMGPISKSNLMNMSLSYSLGNQFDLNKGKLGYNFVLSYNYETKFYDEVVYNRWGIDSDPKEMEFDIRERQVGEIGEENSLLGGLAGVSYKTNKHKVSLNFLHLQSGESKAGKFDYEGIDQGSNFDAIQYNLTYSERSLTNASIMGTHAFDDQNLKLKWSMSPSWSTITDPDVRFTRYRVDAGGFTIGSESGFPERIWRFLEEFNMSSKVDLEYDYSLLSLPSKILLGGAFTLKDRNYEIQNFQIFTNNIELLGDPNEIFQEQNLWSPENFNGVTYDPQFLPSNPNKFDSQLDNTAFYVSNESNLTANFKAILGIRLESYHQYYSGVNQSGETFNDDKVLDNVDLFPALNLIYSINSSQNLRLSMSKTIARPSFKEASFATIIDPLTGRTFIGSFFPDIDVATNETIWDGNISNTDIYNMDLRWELFKDRGQLFSVSGFYKKFINPIEIVQYVQAINNFQPRNVGDGEVLGIEIEMMQNLGFLSPYFENFFANANLTFVDSKIDLSPSELKARHRFAREGQEIGNTREMAGQAPHIINLGLSYKSLADRRLEIGVFYNVQGSTLLFAGISDKPDIFSVPFHSLNLNANLSIGAENKFNIGFKVDNILDNAKEEVARNYEMTDRTFTSYLPGRTVSIRAGYTIN